MVIVSEEQRRGARVRALWTVAGCLVVLVMLAAGVLTSFAPQLRIDTALSSALYAGDTRSSAVTGLLDVVTAPGLSVFRLAVFLPVVVWLLARRRLRTAGWVITAVALVGPLTTVLKDLTGRVRPPFANGGARLTSLSYPSGHSSGIATLVTVALVLAWPLLPVRRRPWWAAAGAVVVVVVGLSRMWLGVHYLSDVVGGWALGIAWTLGLAVAFDALPGGRAALPAAGGLRQQIVLAPDDGSLGPLLRVADDRLPPGAGYGRHEHRAVDVVAVVLEGSLCHRGHGEVRLEAGDVALLQAGAGLQHDEVAGPEGARVLQCYLRSVRPDRPAAHEVHRGVCGWVELGRADARLWVGRAADGPPDGLRLVVGEGAVAVDADSPGAARVVVWQLDRGRPDWAVD